MKKFLILGCFILLALLLTVHCGGGSSKKDEQTNDGGVVGNAKDGGIGEKTKNYKISAITGTIIDQFYAPLAGVKISATYKYEDTVGDTKEVVSGEDGSFHIGELPEGRYEMEFNASHLGDIKDIQFPVAVQFNHILDMEELILTRFKSKTIIQNFSTYNHIKDTSMGEGAVLIPPDAIDPEEDAPLVSVSIEQLPPEGLPNPMGDAPQTLPNPLGKQPQGLPNPLGKTEADMNLGVRGLTAFTMNLEGVRGLNAPMKTMFPASDPTKGTTEFTKMKNILLEGFNHKTGKWDKVGIGNVEKVDPEKMGNVLLGKDTANTPFLTDIENKDNYYITFSFDGKPTRHYYRFISNQTVPENMKPVKIDGLLRFGDNCSGSGPPNVSEYNLRPFSMWLNLFFIDEQDKHLTEYGIRKKTTVNPKSGLATFIVPPAVFNPAGKILTKISQKSHFKIKNRLYTTEGKLLAVNQKNQVCQDGYVCYSLADFKIKDLGSTPLLQNTFCMGSVSHNMDFFTINSNLICQDLTRCIFSKVLPEFNKLQIKVKMEGERVTEKLKNQSFSFRNGGVKIYYPLGSKVTVSVSNGDLGENLQPATCEYNYLPDNSYTLKNVKCKTDNISLSTNDGGGYKINLTFNAKDSDQDKLNDLIEKWIGSAKDKKDTDSDGLSDFLELTLKNKAYWGSSPLSKDTDNDGLSDKDEKDMGLPAHSMDHDRDSLYDGEETSRKTSPFKRDTDNDGIIDGLEVTFGTDPLKKESVPEASIEYRAYRSFKGRQWANMDAAFCDLNADGYDDIIVSHGTVSYGNSNSLILSNGGGGFLPARTFDSRFKDASTSVVCGYINSDTYMDLVFGNTNKDKRGAQSRVYLSKEKFQSNKKVEDLFDIYTLDKNPTQDLALADVDGKNGLDLIVASGHQGQGGAANLVLLNDGTGKFTNQTSTWQAPDNNGETRVVAQGDFNQDDKPDFVFGQDQGLIKVWLNQNNKFIAAKIDNLENGEYLDLQVLDVDGDEKNDIVYTRKKVMIGNNYSLASFNKAIGLCLNNGDGTVFNCRNIQADFSAVKDIPAGSAEFTASAMVDMDGDQLPDLLTASFLDYNYYLRNNGHYNFEYIPFMLPKDFDNTSRIHVFDFNHDNLPDLFMNSLNRSDRDYLLYRGQKRYSNSFLTSIYPEHIFPEVGTNLNKYFSVFGMGFRSGTKVYLKKDGKVVFESLSPKINNSGTRLNFSLIDAENQVTFSGHLNQKKSEYLFSKAGVYDLEVKIPEFRGNQIKHITYVMRDRFTIFKQECRLINKHLSICPPAVAGCISEPEICDGMDNDCDGDTDEGLQCNP